MLTNLLQPMLCVVGGNFFLNINWLSRLARIGVNYGRKGLQGPARRLSARLSVLIFANRRRLEKQQRPEEGLLKDQSRMRIMIFFKASYLNLYPAIKDSQGDERFRKNYFQLTNSWIKFFFSWSQSTSSEKVGPLESVEQKAQKNDSHSHDMKFCNLLYTSNEIKLERPIQEKGGYVRNFICVGKKEIDMQRTASQLPPAIDDNFTVRKAFDTVVD